MYRSCLVFSLFCSALVGGFAGPVQAAKEPAPTIAVSARLFQPRFRVGEPIDVAVTLTNTGKKPEALGGSAYEISSYRFNVTRGDGKKVSLTAFGRRELRPPMIVLANASLSLQPGSQRRIVFPLGRMFDFGNGGTFTVSIGRTIRKYILTGPDTYRDESVTPTAEPLRFSVDPTPFFEAVRPFPAKETLLLSLDGGSSSRHENGYVTALQLQTEGMVSPLLEPLASVSPDSSDMVVSPDGKTAYVAREGELQPYLVQKNRVFKALGPPIALKQHIYHLALSCNKRLLVYGSWGIQDFEVQEDGTLHPRPQPPLIQADNLVWSHDGRVVYLANGSVYSWKVTAHGAFEEVQPHFSLGSMPEELFVSPDDRLLLCKTSFPEPGGNSFKESLALVRLDSHGSLLGEAKLWRNDGEYGLKALGFDPTGKFAFAAHHSELLVFRVQEGTLQLVSRYNTHMGADEVVWGSDKEVFHLLSYNAVFSFRIIDNGSLVPVGVSWGGLANHRAIALVDAPTSPETFGLPSMQGLARLESPTYAPETPVWLDLETKGAPPRIDIVRLGEEVRTTPEFTLVKDPSVELRQEGIKSLASLPAKVRVDLARLFDLSLDGVYVLKITPSQGPSREIRFGIQDSRRSISFDSTSISPIERRAWRFDVLSPEYSPLFSDPQLF